MNPDQSLQPSIIYSPDRFPPPIPPTNPTIKEKLNLHVKRRLQETAPAFCDEVNAFKPKGKRGRRSKKATCTVTSASTNNNALIMDNQSLQMLNASGTDDKIYENYMNPNISTTPVPNQQNKEKDKDKNKKPDILAQILNQKKLSLLQDQRVINILDNITMKARSNRNNNNTNQQFF